MKGKGRIVCVIILTVLLSFLQITNSYASTYNVNVTGQYSIYSPSGGGVSGSTGSFVQAISNLSNHTAYIPLTHSLMSSTYSVLNALYQNCSVPMATQLSYYLPIYKSDLEAVGTGIDSIATSNSQIKTNADSISTSNSQIKSNTDTIISYLQQLVPSTYMDVSIDNDDKNTTGNTIDTILSIVPRDSDENIYSLDLQSILDIYINSSNYQNIMLKNNAYKDWY